MRILFWGTPAFAVPSLRALEDEGFDVVGVVTQPDRPAGRGRRLQPSAVKQVALEHGLPVLSPDRPRGEEFMEAAGALAPDLSVVVAYGHILKSEVLAMPPLGSINVHASLLPALRGAAPINWAIARGFEETGVSIMRMVSAMDAGAVIHQVTEPIFDDETASELSLRLSERGAQALLEALALLGAGGATEVEQDDDAATFAPKINRAVARIDWSRPAAGVANHVRAMDAVPGAWSELEGTPVKLFRPRVVPLHAVVPPPPGAVVVADPSRGVLVATPDGGVLFAEAQPPGKRRMEVRDWINGRGVEPGQCFE